MSEIPINWDNIDDAPLFSLDGLVTDAKCVDVYDGDTVKVVFKFADKMYKWRVRLLRIDTPELRGDEKEEGLKCRDFLRGLVLDKIVTVKCSKFDSFGRILGEIEKDGENINDKMIGFLK